MLNTYDRLMAEQRVKRTREVTVDGRDQGALLRQLLAECEALRGEVMRLRAAMKATARGMEDM